MTLFQRKIEALVAGLKIENLDMEFTIEKSDQTQPNKAELIVYNLNEQHRQQLEQEKNIELVISAGYQEKISLLFKGDVQELFTIFAPPDWITTIRARDGEMAVKSKRTSASFAPGTSFETIWKKFMKDLEAEGLGTNKAAKDFLSNATFKEKVKQSLHGIGVFGPTFKKAKQMAKSHGLDLHIEDKELVVTKIGQPLATTAVDLRPDTGLISSPQKGAKNTLKCRALLIPGLQPKRQIKLTSNLVSGNYVISKVRFNGSTFENDWYADLECKGAA